MDIENYYFYLIILLIVIYLLLLNKNILYRQYLNIIDILIYLSYLFIYPNEIISILKIKYNKIE